MCVDAIYHKLYLPDNFELFDTKFIFKNFKSIICFGLRSAVRLWPRTDGCDRREVIRWAARGPH